MTDAERMQADDPELAWLHAEVNRAAHARERAVEALAAAESAYRTARAAVHTRLAAREKS